LLLDGQVREAKRKGSSFVERTSANARPARDGAAGPAHAVETPAPP